MDTNSRPVRIAFSSEAKQSWFRIPDLKLYSRRWMAFLLVGSDVVCLLLAGALAAILEKALLNKVTSTDQYINTLPLLLVFIVVYTWGGLYPTVGLSPVEEMRKLVVSTSSVFLLLAAISGIMRIGEGYSLLFLTFSWLLALIFVQFGRWMTRLIAIRLGAWGECVAVIGYGSQGRMIVEFLLKNIRLGLRPSLVIDGFGKSETLISSLPVYHITDPNVARLPPKYANIRTAILVISEMPKKLQRAIIDEGGLGFDRLIIITSLGWIGSMAVIPHDLEGILGLEVRQNLLNPLEQSIKHILDISLIIFGGLFVIPLLCFISILIWLDSRGPIFYKQERFGKGQRKIKIWKFRTMVPDADKILENYLHSHPELKVEWETTQKIKNDPRITRVGRVLRKTSLDELPQIWNVLTGEMSLVGPRPIVAKEIRHYGRTFQLYSRVQPGITGLWQVSGRNDLSYDIRLRLDEYYVRNWSIWLDLYILLRTGLVVIRRKGAY